jgi:hypothetical protein
MRKIAILAVFISISCLVFGQKATPVADAQKPQVIQQPIGDHAFTIPAGAFKEFSFTIPDGLQRVGLFGKFNATGGVRNSIEVWVMNDDQFVNWRNHHAVKPLYNSEKVTQGTIKLMLPNEPGATYHIVFNNNFSLLTPKAVEAQLALDYVKQQ